MCSANSTPRPKIYFKADARVYVYKFDNLITV